MAYVIAEAKLRLVLSATEVILTIAVGVPRSMSLRIPTAVSVGGVVMIFLVIIVLLRTSVQVAIKMASKI